MLKQIIQISVMLVFFASCAPPQEFYEEAAYEETLIGNYSSKWSGGASAFPLTMKISGDFEESEKLAINEVSNNWSTPFKEKNIQLFNLVEDSNTNNISDINMYRDNTLGIYKIYEWDSELPASALAVTQIYGNQVGDQIIIYHADILINYDNFSFNEDIGYGHDLQTVIAHEMGHFLGLYHEYSSTDDSIMYPSISRFTINRSPKDTDVNNIKYKYQISYSQSNNQEISGDSKPVLIRQYLFANGDCKHSVVGEKHVH